MKKFEHFLWFWAKMAIRVFIAYWVTHTFFPDSLGTLVFVVCLVYMLGKLICGGYSTKKSTNTEEV